jgi:integrase
MCELRRHQRESLASPFVFAFERGTPLSALGFSRMLRHACGYELANDGHDTRAIQAHLGHCNIQNTTRYTALAPQRSKVFFRD